MSKKLSFIHLIHIDRDQAVGDVPCYSEEDILPCRCIHMHTLVLGFKDD